MRRCTLRLALLFALGCFVVAAAPPRAAAYDRYTHRWLTRMAVRYLVSAYPGKYDQLLKYVDDVADGAQAEDGEILDGDTNPLTLRVMRHFFRPTDEAGLTMPGIGTFPNSYQWGILPNKGNVWGWDDGMRYWREGDIVKAYETAGHIVHLIQDLTVPAHTHLDIHGPPAGDDYENYCEAQMIDEFHSNLPTPPPGTPIPQFATLHDAWMATANASYWRNMYPGDLSDTNAPKGIITQMFPSIEYAWDHWKIPTPSVGVLGQYFFEHQPGFYYFKRTKYPAAVDVLTYDTATDQATYGTNADGAPMVALMARDLIPLAILNSAGVMKMYLDQMYSIQPGSGASPTPTPDPSTTQAGCDAGGGHPSDSGWLLPALLATLLIALRRRNSCDELR